MRILLLCLALAASGAAAAQGPPGTPPPPDTTSAWRYAPLHLGDAWEYRVEGQDEGGAAYAYTLTRQVRPRVTVGGLRYAVVRERAFDVAPGTPNPPEAEREYLARFDTSAAQVFVRQGPGDAEEPETLCRLDLPFRLRNANACGAAVEVSTEGGYAQGVAVGSETVTTSRKVIEVSALAGFTYEYAADVGLVRYAVEEAQSETWTLVAARVEGRTYGDPGEGFPGIPDTTDPARYAPLAVGDTWHYRTCGPFGCPRAQIRRVTAERSISDTLYAVVEGASFAFDGTEYELTGERESLVRYDARTSALFERLGDRDVQASCPLGADFEVRFPLDDENCGGGFVTALDDDTYGQVKSISTLGGSVGYAVDIGEVSFMGDASTESTDLVYARVGGQVIGSPLPVTRETPPLAPALALSAHPSPTAGPLAVAASGARGPVRLEAFSVLGRRVLSRTLAPEARVEIDATAWAPGLYVLRATAGGAVATARVVRR